MIIVALADTHGMHEYVKVPDGDILVFAGDMCGMGNLEEVKMFSYQLDSLPHKHKIVIAGNHDRPFAYTPRVARQALENSCIYLEDEACEINGVSFYGSPYTPEFLNWYFMLPRGDAIKTKWDMIPDNTDVLITHGPPLNILDATTRGEHVGCYDLARAVERIKLKIHVFGHIHCQHGKTKIGNTTYINCSICDEVYDPIQCPMVFEMEDK